MDEGFYLFSEYLDEGKQAKHYMCGDYHLWVWSNDGGDLLRFEFRHKDKRIVYSGGEFSRGAENYVGPMFFILDQLFNCDGEMQAKLLRLRDDSVPELQSPGPAEAGELRHAM